MKKNTLGRIVLTALSFLMLLLLADNVSAQRGGGGHPSYHFGGGAHFGSCFASQSKCNYRQHLVASLESCNTSF